MTIKQIDDKCCKENARRASQACDLLERAYCNGQVDPVRSKATRGT